MSQYGLDSFAAAPPLAALSSLLLLSGCDAVGLTTLRAFGLCSEDAPRWHRWQAVIVGTAVVSIVLYPLALANLTPLPFMRAAACGLAGIGLRNVGVWILRRARRGDQRARSAVPAGGLTLWSVLLALLLVGAGLLALGPVTDADSLDYHMGVAVSLLRNGGMPFAPEWLHGRLAGSQEVLYALGLAVGAEQFGALLQVSGLIGIAGLLLFADSFDGDPSPAASGRVRMMAAVAAVSAPLVVGLISQKPQLLAAAMTSLALALVCYPSRHNLDDQAALRSHGLVCVLVMSASQARLSSLLGGGVVGLLSLAVMIERRLFWRAVTIGIVALTIIVAPPVAWKRLVYHDGIVNSLVKPLPGNWPGTGTFDAHLRQFRRSAVPFQVLMVVSPRPDAISTILGPAGVILLLMLRPWHDRWRARPFGAAIFVIVALLLLGPFTARYYFEPYVWLLMLLALQGDRSPLARAPWITWPLMIQSVVTIGLFWYGAATLLPGSLTRGWRSTVMDRSANGERVMTWAGTVLPPDAVLLSSHRSLALAPRDAVSMDWSAATEAGSPEAAPYLARLKERGVTHMLVLGSPPDFAGLSGCAGALVAGPGEDRLAARNPFWPETRQPAWIFEFDASRLPGCATARSR